MRQIFNGNVLHPTRLYIQYYNNFGTKSIYIFTVNQTYIYSDAVTLRGVVVLHVRKFDGKVITKLTSDYDNALFANTCGASGTIVWEITGDEQLDVLGMVI
jgi:hypothetical protein